MESRTATAIRLVRQGEVYFVKPALVESALFIVSTQTGPTVVLHAPLQLVKARPGSGVAVSVTTVPAAKLAAQVLPQLMPAGELVTVPGLPRLTFSA